MDTSETYIKMCEKAEEIQESYLEKCKQGWLRTSAVGLLVNAIDYNGEVFTSYGLNVVWLPHQDQLQEIYLEPYRDRLIVEEFYSWFEKLPFSPQFTSMEQLWLAFVMKEKYNKVWDGEDWHLQKT